MKMESIRRWNVGYFIDGLLFAYGTPAIDCQSVRWYILFPHAKMRKYGTQNFVGADFAYDFAKVVEGFAQVLGDQVRW